jgi:hypothetical protein
MELDIVDSAPASVPRYPRLARPCAGELKYCWNRCLCVHSHILTRLRDRPAAPSTKVCYCRKVRERSLYRGVVEQTPKHTSITSLMARFVDIQSELSSPLLFVNIDEIVTTITLVPRRARYRRFSPRDSARHRARRAASYRASDLVLWHIPAIRFGIAPRFERPVRIGLFCYRISSPRALC